MAFLGQVPVKVRGPVAASDYIVPSGENDGVGVAVALEDLTLKQATQMVGVAWETAEAKGVKLINTVVGASAGQARAEAIIQLQQSQLATLRQENAELESRLAALEQLSEK